MQKLKEKRKPNHNGENFWRWLCLSLLGSLSHLSALSLQPPHVLLLPLNVLPQIQKTHKEADRSK
ncbi:hypothetical protein CJ030_MR2G019408 [Morella rubra]|uniref:Uncharacterized protein n=1 Tax=Morella rubra TaxID=262757 RepID=A0A6A1WHQ0_9ROSI|nr:hypothetical protein CJ030_MR2G019408 [Morella rubra]